MPAANTASRYGTVTKVFHWLTALFILTVIPLGAIANRLPYETDAQLALKAQLFSLHKTLGVVIFLVALARILWAITQTKPGGLHPERKVETTLAELVHWLLYISLVTVPMTGWIHHAATTGFAPILLPIGQDLPFISKNEATSELFATLHWIWSKIMVGAILLHIAGALKHHIIDKDSTLRRMWFGQAASPDTPAHVGASTAPLAAVVIYAAATGAGVAAGLFSHDTKPAGPALEQVASDWVVNDGSIGITVVQLGGDVAGEFTDWTAAIRFDPEGNSVLGDVTTTIAINSLTLGSVGDQAMGADFFDAATHPTAIFAGDITDNETGYIADGNLTIKGNTVPVTLPFELTIVDGVATMSGAIALDRRDFNVGESMADESSLGFAVEVAIVLTATRS